MKNKNIALFLLFFNLIGIAGLHRFYVGKTKTGILYLLTFGLFGIGSLLDFIMLLQNKFTDKNGMLLQSEALSLYSSSSISNKNQVDSSKNESPLIQKQIKEFTFEEAVDVYVRTNHMSCKSIYSYDFYFSDAFECILNNIPQHEINLSEEKVLRKKEIYNPIDSTKNITKSSNRFTLGNFIAIDTETTGLKTGGNDIIEICAIKFKHFKPIEKFHSYLKPRKSIPTDATAVNHITDNMVANAPTFSQIKSDLQDFIGDFNLVAHNAPFDMKFLHVSGLDLENHKQKVYCTLNLARLKLHHSDGEKYESYKLENLCEEQNIACSNFHSAEADSLACGILFIDIIREVFQIDDVT